MNNFLSRRKFLPSAGAAVATGVGEKNLLGPEGRSDPRGSAKTMQRVEPTEYKPNALFTLTLFGSVLQTFILDSLRVHF